MGAQVKTAYATLVGDIVAARYRVVGEVGRTDFGVLYTAEDLQIPGRSVAINVLTGDLPDAESERRRFEFETESLARRADIDLTDFINAGRLADGRPYWVLACEAIVPDIVLPEDLRHAVSPAQTATAISPADLPRRLERYEHVPVYRRQRFLLGFYALPVLLAVIAAVGAKVTPEEPARPVRAAERRLSYTVFAQRYLETLPLGDPVPVQMPYAFAPDERVRLEFATPEEGYLYVVKESAPGVGGTPNYTVLFPFQGRGEQSAYLDSNRPMIVPREGHIDFSQGEDAERLWIVWSTAALDAFSGLTPESRLDTTQAAAIQQIIARRATAPVRAVSDPASRRVQAVSTSDLWVQLIGLSRQ
jgi:hypothetical protein